MNNRKTLTIIMAISLILMSYWSFAQTAEELFPKGIQLEEVKGELEKAIEVYQTIVTRFSANRPIAAKAQFHIGLCYEKLGNHEAKKAYQEVIRNYGEQKDFVTEARTRLAILERSIGPTEAKSMFVRKVWAGPDVDIMGAISPDGRYLSFVDWDTGDLAIYELATGKKRRLSNKGSWDESDEFAEYSRWSPDGKQIVYDWYNKNDFVDLCIIGLDGSKPRILYSNEEVVWAQCYDWSTDGKQILAWFIRKDKTRQIVLVSASDGSVRVLKTLVRQGRSAWPQNMSFSPDGRYIVYDIPPKEDSPERDIFMLSTDGSGEISLVEHPANDVVLGWVPDEKSILFASDRNGTWGFWIIQVVEGKPQENPKLVKSNMGSIEPMGFTQNGIFYYGISQRMTDIYIAELDPETGKILTPPNKAIRQFEGYNQTPEYSPDGKYLAYISRRFPMITRSVFGGNVLCIKSLETGKEREFHPALNRFGFPRWSPDGSSVLVVHWSANNQMGYYQIDTQTGNATPALLTEGNLLFGGHEWSLDGNTIFYGLRDEKSRIRQILVRDLESGKEKKLYQSDDFFNLSLSPDGHWLALCFPRLNVINVIPAAGGESRELCRFKEEEGVRFGQFSSTWTANGKYILFAMKNSKIDDAKWELCRIPADGGEIEKLGLKMEGAFYNLCAHPDGRHIAFSSSGNASPEVWIMENFLPEIKAEQ